MKRVQTLILAASLGLAACAQDRPVEPRIVFPGNPPGVVTTDPVRASAFVTEALLTNPSRMNGRPDMAAETVARYEFLTVAFPERYWQAGAVLAAQQLQRARPQLRDAMGIRQTVAPQLVVDAFWNASQLLAAGDRDGAAAALEPVISVPGEQALARLDPVRPVPDAGRAAQMAAGAIKSEQGRNFPLFGQFGG